MSDAVGSLDHWDMRTGRNVSSFYVTERESLDHWDMRTGRNLKSAISGSIFSLDHWDMRTGRNPAMKSMASALRQQCS